MLQGTQQAGPSSQARGGRERPRSPLQRDDAQSLTGSEYSGSFTGSVGSVTTLATHSYTTGYRTSIAGSDVDSNAGSYVSQSRGLKRSMSRCALAISNQRTVGIETHERMCKCHRHSRMETICKH